MLVCDPTRSWWGGVVLIRRVGGWGRQRDLMMNPDLEEHQRSKVTSGGPCWSSNSASDLRSACSRIFPSCSAVDLTVLHVTLHVACCVSQRM